MDRRVGFAMNTDGYLLDAEIKKEAEDIVNVLSLPPG